MKQELRSERVRLALASIALGTAALTACSSDSDDSDSRDPRSTSQSVVVGAPVEINERFVAYLADEASTGAGGTDFNGDGDVIDAIAVVVNVANQDERTLDVAASNLAMVRTNANGAHLYLVTDEALDGTDWDGDTVLDDTVLLHVDVNLAGPVEFVSLLGGTQLAKVGTRVYFGDDGSTLVSPDTSIQYVDVAAPTTVVRVSNADAANTLAPVLLGSEDGMIFLSLDETVELRDLNGDADMLDADVLALLDGTDPAALVVEVPLAMQDASTPVRALDIGTSWVVALLVDEAGQGAQNLNDPVLFGASWKPTQCATFEDADATDEVLFFLDYLAFVTNPFTDAPVNSGLVGADRVLIVDDGSAVHVATVSPETSEGTCDLNGDGDTLDRILRWTEATEPVLPFTGVNQLQALFNVAGGTRGATALSQRFVAVISELEDGRDHDGDPASDNNLVAWLDPADGTSAAWQFDHSNPGGGAIDAVGTAWMGEQDGAPTRLGVGFEEDFFGDINGDGDTLDSVPTFVRFNGPGTELDFPGPTVAVAASNAGIQIVNDLAFYRVDEAADDRDWNQDGDQTDFALFRTTVSTLQNSFLVGTLNSASIPAVDLPDLSTKPVAVTFVADETAEGTDFNKDGDTSDQVLRWFRVD